MPQGNTPVFVTLIVVVLAVVGGFFFIFDRVANLSTEVKNLGLRLEMRQEQVPPAAEPAPQPAPAGVSPGTEPPATSTSPSALPTGAASIPAAIIFQVSSSEALPPQAPLTVTVEGAERSANGASVVFRVKVFSADAKGYTALDPRTVLELLNLDGDNTKAASMTGSFTSIPAKGAVTGTVSFPINLERRTVILQINLPEPRFYEFDFDKQTYRQAEVG